MNFINPLFAQSILTIGFDALANYIFWLIALLALVLSLMNTFRMAKIKKILEVNASNQKSDIELIKNSIMQNRKNINDNRNKNNRRQNTRKPKETIQENKGVAPQKEQNKQNEQNKPEKIKTDEKKIVEQPRVQSKRNNSPNSNKKRKYTPRKPKDNRSEEPKKGQD